MQAARPCLTLVSLLALAAPAAAGPIEFRLTTTELTVDPGHPALSAALVAAAPEGSLTFDRSLGLPTYVPVVVYDPSRLPTPAPRDVHPDGTAGWNDDGYFTAKVRLTDVASGQFADLTFTGRAHMYNHYENGQWGGVTYFWFWGWPATAYPNLGENPYVVWGASHYTAGPATAAVWVGRDAPADASTPEPPTAVLAGLALLPVGMVALRRRAIPAVATIPVLSRRSGPRSAQ